MKINKLLESKKLKEGYSHFEFTSGSNPYIAKTKDEAERIKRSRGDSVRYIGNIDGIDYYKVDDSEKDLFRVEEGWYEDHLDTMQRKTSGYDKCYKIVKKARTSNPIDTNALNDARDHFGYDLYKMCLDDVLKEMDNLDEAFKPSDSEIQKEYDNYCKDLGIDSSKKSSKNRFMADYGKHLNNFYGIKDIESKLNQTSKAIKEAFKPSESGIQSVKCYNRYNYTIQELRVDNDNKTFERGQFTAGKADKKTKNRQEFEDIVDTLKSMGYKELDSEYRSMRNKSRNGVVQESAKVFGDKAKKLNEGDSFKDVKKNANDTALRDGYHQVIFFEDGGYWFKRDYPNNGIDPATIVGRVKVKWDKGIMSTEYEHINDEIINESSPSELTDCPECGDISFDSKKGKCTKCSYRESIKDSVTCPSCDSSENVINNNPHRDNQGNYIYQDYYCRDCGIYFDKEDLNEWAPNMGECPACGDTSFDTKRGRCTKCSYRESLNESDNYKVKFFQVFEAPKSPKENGKMIGQRGTLDDANAFGKEKAGEGNYIIKAVCDDGKTRPIDNDTKASDYRMVESIKVSTIADYITDHYEFDDIDDKYSCINSIRDSFKGEKTISWEELEQFIGAHNGRDKKMDEDASYEWKPDTSFKHIKDIYNKVKANDYKYVNNEREEFMAAVKKADNKGYKPEQCRQIKDWHRDIWSHNRRMTEGMNDLRNEKGQVMADKWYASKWPDDEIGIEQLMGITLDDALKDRSILGHCDTQVRERVYTQLDKYIPLSKESPMYKEVNEASEGFQKEFYNGYVILKNRAGDGWDIYSYDGTPEKVKKAYLEDEGYATLKDAKAEIDEWNSKGLSEASYGGAFDIIDDEYFTRDDINYAAEDVVDNINETFDDKFILGGTWFENGKWIVNVQTEDGMEEYEDTVKVDMRKIRTPMHLKHVYAIELAAKLIAKIKEEKYGMTEAVSSSAHNFEDDNVDDLSYYYDDEIFNDNLENSPYSEVASKQVPDSDGFMTDYTMYLNINTGEYVFVFGDKDIYSPEDGRFDWECETEEEAEEWFSNYNGFVDDDEDWRNESLKEATETTSPIVHKKNDGSYLVASDSGDGYTAFNKSDVCVGHISAQNDNEAKSKFNSNKFDENLNK